LQSVTDFWTDPDGNIGKGGPSATAPSRLDVAKDYLSVTGSFLQLVLKKVPDAVDSNPVKVFFSLAKIVLELKEVRRLWALDILDVLIGRV
jgi:hypothetical protein